MESKTVTDLKRITGLNDSHAKKLFDLGGYRCALASFAQTFNRIPKSSFDDAEIASRNAEVINKELRQIYKEARERKNQLPGKTDEEVWKSLSSPADGAAATNALNSAVPKTASPAFTFGAKPADAAATTNALNSAVPKTASPAFTFGAKPAGGAATTSTPNPGMNFGFGSSHLTGNATALPGFEIKKSEESVPITETKEVRQPKYCDPKHNVGPFLDIPDFWVDEVEEGASLFNCDGGFLARNKDSLRPMMEKWVVKANFYSKPVKYVEIEDPDEETVRVIIKDADRTFLKSHNREKLVAFLHAMQVELGAYGQAMSYLAALCMLALTEEETASILRFVSTEYIKGHWAAEAVGFSISAWTVEYFMKKKYPDVAKHLEELKFWPDTYLQKILTGLCIHVLSFNELFTFLDNFMNGGLQYLICFCLAVVEHFRDKILKIQSTLEANTLYSIMRLSSSVCHNSDVNIILERSKLIDLGEEGESSLLSSIRSRVYDEKVAPRLQRAPKVDTFDPCEICEKNRPTWFSDETGAVCDECKKNNPNNQYEKF